MQNKNIQILEDTLRVLRRGKYVKGNQTIGTKLSEQQMEQARVYLPDEIRDIAERKDFDHVHVLGGRIGVGCRKIDSLGMALEQQKHKYLFSGKKQNRVLVLNFANPVHPGGGVRSGAMAQEEDLCRRSSLLLSLESQQAQRYYQYNQSLHSSMSSDAILLSPHVEIIRDANGELMDETVVVSVMTCAAPIVTHGLEGLSDAQYRELFYHRICGMLKCAAYWGYEVLTLGAFGCGAFGNDAKLVSDLFYKALEEFNFDGMRAASFFQRIDFAVTARSSDYNFNEFSRNFSNFYRAEDAAEIERIEEIKREKRVNLDRIRGCLFGGAVGDALGYPVEFMSESAILGCYGTEGITEYALDRTTGKVLISDDTQMTLFTANGLLVGATRMSMQGIAGRPSGYVEFAYQDWLYTQTGSYDERAKRGGNQHSWLCDVPELYARRAPGNTCLSALSAAHKGTAGDYIAAARNNSKGCGGVMRVAPVALSHLMSGEMLDREAAQVAAITHGHSLGYMPAAVLCHIIDQIVFPAEQKRNLKAIVIEARNATEKMFAGDEHLKELADIIDRAVAFSENEASDRENIRSLGQGWVAEEALAIAIYCSLRYTDDFSKGIIAAVNHSGDSDSTGAVTGNILGALTGYEAMEDKWKKDLECADVILEMAEDLCYGCQMEEYSPYHDEDWARKYMQMRWKDSDSGDKCVSEADAIDSVNRMLRNGEM